MVHKRYQIDIGEDDETGNWVAIVASLADKKVNHARATKLGPLFTRLSKSIRKKAVQARSFPLPEEQRIIILPPKIVSPDLIIPNGN